MEIARIDLKDGAWVMAHSRPSHGQLKSLFRQQMANLKGDKAEESLADTIMTLCTEWHMPFGEGGASLPFSRQGVNEAPNDIMTDLYARLDALSNRDKPLASRLLALAETLPDESKLRAKIVELAAEAEVPEESVAGN